MLFVTVITAFGMIVLLASWVIYDPPFVNGKYSFQTVLFSGCDYWNTKESPIEKRNVAVMGFAIMGSFIAGANYIYRRFATIDLTPGNFFSVGMRMVLSVIVALLFSLLTLDAGFESGNHILALAFFIGMFPERGLTQLLLRFKKFQNTDASKLNRPLEAIEGISEMHKLRLTEVGIDNVQNLANFNFFSLVIKTPFPARLLLDWVAQAKLMVEFHQEYSQLRKGGIRHVLDFIDAVEQGRPSPTNENIQQRLKEISDETGVGTMTLEVNYFNFKEDQSVQLLNHVRAHQGQFPIDEHV